MKKTKIIVPALGMLLLSTAASVTGTVAWFTANKTVTASGMQIRAKAEDGIVINNDECKTNNWKTSTVATHGNVVDLNPTSTADGETWYHATSDDMNNHVAEGEYEELTLSVDHESKVGDGGIGYVETTGNTAYDSTSESAYYLLNNFYIRSSSNALTNQTFYINKVNAKVSGTSSSVDLNKSLRVLVKVNAEDAKIFAPFADSVDYTVFSGTYTGTEVKTPVMTDVKALQKENGLYNEKVGTENSWTIPNNQAEKDDCIRVACYAYFEGEDIDCKSANIKDTLDTLQLDFAFGLKALAA